MSELRVGCHQAALVTAFLVFLLGMFTASDANAAPPKATAAVSTCARGGDCKPVAKQVRHKEEEEEPDVAPAEQGDPVMGAVAAAAGAFGTLCGAHVALVLFGFIIGFIPVIGWVYQLSVPFLVGAAGGIVAYIITAKVSKRRVPLLPVMGSVMASVCGGFVWNLLATLVSYGCLGCGYVFVLVGTNDPAYLAFGLAALAGGCVFGAVGCLGLLGSYAGGSVLGALLGMKMGRPLGEGEAELNWDMTAVPEYDPSDGEDADDEEDRPRPKKKHRRQEFDDDEQ